MILLKIDWLQVTIASATAATFFAVVGVALFQAWLDRAWLNVRLVRSGVLGEWVHTSPKHARLAFEIEVVNRARRANAIQGCAIIATAPTARTWNRSDLEFRMESFGGAAVAFPLELPTPGIARIPIVIVLAKATIGSAPARCAGTFRCWTFTTSAIRLRSSWIASRTHRSSRNRSRRPSTARSPRRTN